MALPKGKLMALLAVFAAIGLITATGAFTTVTADRTATVATAGDASANLGLTPYAGPNGYAPTADTSASLTNSYGYAQISDGTLTINLGGYEAGSAENRGVNYNAVTTFDNVFNISNNGEQDINVHIDVLAGNHPGTVSFFKGTDYTSTGNMTTSSNTVTITPGETIQVSIQVDLTDKTASDVTSPLVSEIQITAQA